MKRIYFDNAATSFPKPASVTSAVTECINEYCGNPGRSSHTMSLRSAEEIFAVRELVADMFGINAPENVVFTYNATYALNLAIKTLIPSNCHVIISDIEHNSVIRPLEALRLGRNVRYSCFDSSKDVFSEISSMIKPDTAAIISTLASNVTGERIDLETLSLAAKRYGLKLILDASQIAGHKRIDLSSVTFDALCAPGHKGLLGIQGCGFVIFSSGERCGSFIEGGSGSDSLSKAMPMLLPEGYEAGTLSTPSIVALGAGIKYINSVGIDNISRYLSRLTLETVNGLVGIPGIRVYGDKGGIVSFNYADVPSEIIAIALNKRGICVRGGIHCAPSVHRKLGTQKQGAVRVSFSSFNTEDEVKELIRSLYDVVREL